MTRNRHGYLVGDCSDERVGEADVTAGEGGSVSGGPVDAASLDLRVAEHAGREGRAFVRVHVERWGVPEDRIDVTTLLTSELIANAVRYAPPPLRLTVSNPADAVRVEVADSSSSPPGSSPAARELPDLDAVNGRGMWLLETLASRWGYDTTPVGKRVWFEVSAASPTVPA